MRKRHNSNQLSHNATKNVSSLGMKDHVGNEETSSWSTLSTVTELLLYCYCTVTVLLLYCYCTVTVLLLYCTVLYCTVHTMSLITPVVEQRLEL